MSNQRKGKTRNRVASLGALVLDFRDGLPGLQLYRMTRRYVTVMPLTKRLIWRFVGVATS